MGIITRVLLGQFLENYIFLYALIGGLTLAMAYWMRHGRTKISSVPMAEQIAEKESDPSRNAETAEIYDDEDFDSSKLVPPKYDTNIPHMPFQHRRYSVEESIHRSADFYKLINSRRSVRTFSDEDVSKLLLDNIILTAGTAPSGAHTEPWTYVALKDPELKKQLREIIEYEEEISYLKRMGKQWVNDLKFLRTNWVKEYLTEAPWIVAVFRQAYLPQPGEKRRVHYYNEISTSISVGIFLAALQNAGLVTVTTTPLNCGPPIRRLLGRPDHEKLLFILPIGYPSKETCVAKVARKPLSDIMVTIGEK